ncbi:MAG TPA: OmpA family protein [Bryobacteraceae bacterium]|nr:OmpA family protein [Bryobacteraceae bacterium]
MCNLAASNYAMTLRIFCLLSLATALTVGQDTGQAPPPGSDQTVANPTSQPVANEGETPVFRVEVVSRTLQAVNYRHRGGATHVNFQGTALMPRAHGEAKVESERGVIHVNADFSDMTAPEAFGPEYLTYVLWAISTEGRPVNLGELTLSDYGQGSKSSISTTSDLQAFGMIVTAEPYYAVTQPSDVVVLENVIRPDTRGVIESVDAKYELLPRGLYTMHGKAPGFVAPAVSKKVPFELFEAENAVQLARIAGADKYAADSYQKAVDALSQAHRYEGQKPGQKPVVTMARQAVQQAEDARVIALKREAQERLDQERAAAQAREDAAKAQAAAEAQQRAEAEARAREEAERRAQAQADAAAAEKAKAEALAAAQQAQQERAAAEQAKLEADQARQAALAQQQQLAAAAEAARQQAAAAEAARQQAILDQQHLRQQLLEQFSQILQTRDTPRGLVVNMSDVLFDTARYNLRPAAQVKLARLSGIVISHPGLKLQVEGYTDSVGSDEYNMRLSQKRADSVREYLISQGIGPDLVTAQGFGKADPVADNHTAAGRQQNRRVELVVSGEIIGTNINQIHSQTMQTTPEPETAPGAPGQPMAPSTPQQTAPPAQPQQPMEPATPQPAPPTQPR